MCIADRGSPFFYIHIHYTVLVAATCLAQPTLASSATSSNDGGVNHFLLRRQLVLPIVAALVVAGAFAFP